MFAEVERAINRDIKILAEDAEAVANEYWQEHNAQNKELHGSDRGRVGVRVRLRNGENLTIEWYCMIWTKQNPPRMLSKHIKRGKAHRYRYPKTAFEKVAKGWELELIKEAEDQFEEIRRTAKLLAAWRKATRMTARGLGLEDELEG